MPTTWKTTHQFQFFSRPKKHNHECDNNNNGGKIARESSTIREKLRLDPKDPPHISVMTSCNSTSCHFLFLNCHDRNKGKNQNYSTTPHPLGLNKQMYLSFHCLLMKGILFVCAHFCLFVFVLSCFREWQAVQAF